MKPPNMQFIEDLEADGDLSFRKGALSEHAKWVRWAVSQLAFYERSAADEEGAL